MELPEVILEVMGWVPELTAAFTAASGGRARMGDLPLSIAACLTAHSLNVGYRPIVKKGVPALEQSRLSHVYQNYFRPETLSAANVPLVDAQTTLRLARAWGGGLVAAVDGMRFVVPVPAAFARPNRKYFGSKRGMTWLNAMGAAHGTANPGDRHRLLRGSRTTMRGSCKNGFGSPFGWLCETRRLRGVCSH
ncbi:Tn3 family transposase [Subtercola vilae]|uniref:Tn3 family transposase n=1 Tax=Subtercola vilae TaxID=2056433 RepID=UPI0010AAAB69|nr:Tn3 family transposase [Subtercola vilae]